MIPMKLSKAHLVLVDISGYTKFIRLHRLSLIHAERIITELLNCVIDASDHPLALNKLEGDAALFFATYDETIPGKAQACAAAVLNQITGFFDIFNVRERELVSACSLCACEACARVDRLRIKVIAHSGTILLKQVRHLEEIAGEDVILAHRLLKNSVNAEEYLLLTDAFHSFSGNPEGRSTESLFEIINGDQKVDLHVHYPSPVKTMPRSSFWKNVGTYFRLEAYTLKRLVTKAKRPFRHLS